MPEGGVSGCGRRCCRHRCRGDPRELCRGERPRRRRSARGEQQACQHRDDHKDRLRRRERRPPHRRSRQVRSRRRDGPRARESRSTHGRGAAAHGDLRQLPRDPRHQSQGRLRNAIRAEHRCRRQGHARRREDRGHGVPRVRGRRHRQAECHADGPGARQLPQGPRMHRRRSVVRLARGVRRDRLGRRVGPQARLCCRVYRQGHGPGRVRPRDEHGEPAERRACQRRCGRQGLQLHPRSGCVRARSVQPRLSEPRRVQARDVEAESREGLGRERARRRAHGVLRAQRAVRGRAARRHAQGRDRAGQHDRDRIVRFERRCRRDRRGRAGHRRA